MAISLPANIRSVGAPLPAPIVALQRQLMINQRRYAELDAYYRGQHTHTFDSLRFQQAFGRQLASFADNWMKMVIQVTVNRLRIEGFRVGDADDLSATDADAWEVWRRNRLRRESRKGHRDAMKFGTSFVMVDPFAPDGTPLAQGAAPTVTVESPMQVIGHHYPTDRTKLVDAIKKWVGSDGFLYLNYYTPDVVLKYRSVSLPPTVAPADDMGKVLQQATWIALAEVPNPLGEVPIVPVENEPDSEEGGTSDLTTLIPLNDGLNKTLRDALVASEYQGFRQRAVMGVETPKDPVTGQPLTAHQAQLRASQSSVWFFPSPDTKVTEFGQIDLHPHMTMVDMFIHHMSMVSQTPAYMLVGKMANLPLALDTIVPTPSGRTTMGDLKAGDTVYAPDGSEQKVLDVLPIRHGRRCFRLVFDDGTEIVADAEHKWETTHFANPERPYGRRTGAQRETSVVTTEQIAQTLKTSMGTHNHFIPVAEALQGPTLTLPIDGYALGCWLADGNRAGSQITSHFSEASALAERLRSVGETVSVYPYPASDEHHRDTRLVNPTRNYARCTRDHVRPRGTKAESARCPTCTNLHFRHRYYGEPVPAETNTPFKRRLRQLGVLGNKHIPEQYFHGSVEQRLALLRGIMDGDGSVASSNTTGVCITLHDQRLAHDVHRLAQSLGHKVKLRRRRWSTSGGSLPSVRRSEGECWRMSWTPPHIVFRMERKANLQRLPNPAETRGKAQHPFRRYVVSCEPTESVPVRCINVAGPAHTFLATDACIKTHNSADAIRAAELGFVGKLEGKQQDYDPSWDLAMDLSLRAMRRTGEPQVVETIWKDAAANSGSILANELAIMGKLGVPQTALLEKYGYSPTTIARWKATGELNNMDALEAAALPTSTAPMSPGNAAPDD